MHRSHRPPLKLHNCKNIKGWEAISRVLEVGQTPIGKTPRSCPATYVGFWDTIRRLFAETPEARMRGYGPGRFSFNVHGGRCNACEGQGVKRIEMSFLPNVTVTWEASAKPHTQLANVEKLIGLLHRLVAAGNTVVIIEHNLDLIAKADWLIDLGPEGGDAGGRIVAEGAPETVARVRRGSHTAKTLASFLRERSRWSS